MAYADFSLASLQTKFQLLITEDQKLFEAVSPVEISASLAELLTDNIPLALAIDTEKARSEFIIAPLLADYRRRFKFAISLFSGVEFNVDLPRGLNGVCDFMISRSTEQLYISAPVIMLVEAKNNRIKEGLPQCIAEMLAARLFNEQQSNPQFAVYGVVSTGSLWRFLKLEGQQVFIDQDEYHIRELAKIFGILVFMSGLDYASLEQYSGETAKSN
jgi:hypothetical protein